MMNTRGPRRDGPRKVVNVGLQRRGDENSPNTKNNNLERVSMPMPKINSNVINSSVFTGRIVNKVTVVPDPRRAVAVPSAGMASSRNPAMAKAGVKRVGPERESLGMGAVLGMSSRTKMTNAKSEAASMRKINQILADVDVDAELANLESENREIKGLDTVSKPNESITKDMAHASNGMTSNPGVEVDKYQHTTGVTRPRQPSSRPTSAKQENALRYLAEVSRRRVVAKKACSVSTANDVNPTRNEANSSGNATKASTTVSNAANIGNVPAPSSTTEVRQNAPGNGYSTDAQTAKSHVPPNADVAPQVQCTQQIQQQQDMIETLQNENGILARDNHNLKKQLHKLKKDKGELVNYLHSECKLESLDERRIYMLKAQIVALEQQLALAKASGGDMGGRPSYGQRDGGWNDDVAMCDSEGESTARSKAIAATKVPPKERTWEIEQTLRGFSNEILAVLDNGQLGDEHDAELFAEEMRMTSTGSNMGCSENPYADDNPYANQPYGQEFERWNQKTPTFSNNNSGRRPVPKKKRKPKPLPTGDWNFSTEVQYEDIKLSPSKDSPRDTAENAQSVRDTPQRTAGLSSTGRSVSENQAASNGLVSTGGPSGPPFLPNPKIRNFFLNNCLELCNVCDSLFQLGLQAPPSNRQRSKVLEKKLLRISKLLWDGKGDAMFPEAAALMETSNQNQDFPGRNNQSNQNNHLSKIREEDAVTLRHREETKRSVQTLNIAIPEDLLEAWHFLLKQRVEKQVTRNLLSTAVKEMMRLVAQWRMYLYFMAVAANPS